MDGPQHNQRWRGTFRIGEVTVGVSGWKSSKGEAKEEAARFALEWLDQHEDNQYATRFGKSVFSP
jgi:dsRNA-specific ribonuclease